MSMNNAYKVISSPVGELKLVAAGEGLVAILWENGNPKRMKLGALVENSDHPVLLETERQLKEYFQGTRKSFSLERRGPMENWRGSSAIRERREQSERPTDEIQFPS
jgi:O6-methylguanine-DNA--protein-cysteine methyltransferase